MAMLEENAGIGWDSEIDYYQFQSSLWDKAKANGIRAVSVILHDMQAYNCFDET